MWKKERLDKRAAEEEARRAKEATGRAMFEAGGWEGSSDEESDDEDEGDEGRREEWNMAELREETERLREESEQVRLQAIGGQVAVEEGGGGQEGEEQEDAAVGVNVVGS